MNIRSSQSSLRRPTASQVKGAVGLNWRPRSWFVAVLVFAAITAGSVVWLWAQGPQPSFGPLMASPPNIVFSTPTTVTFTIRIDTPTLNPTSVELLRVNAAGETIERVGRMYDNGQSGDAKPGDRTFTTTLILNEPAFGRAYFRVAAAFRGNRPNATSGTLALDVDPFPLPPDPGEAGKQTLAGIDSDGDGVRDDVQRWIALMYAHSEEMRLALQQSAIALQNALLALDASTAQRATSEELAAARCLAYFTDDPRAMTQLTDQMLNTDLRRRAYGAYTDLFDGPVDSPALDQLKTFCTFDSDRL